MPLEKPLPRKRKGRGGFLLFVGDRTKLALLCVGTGGGGSPRHGRRSTSYIIAVSVFLLSASCHRFAAMSRSAAQCVHLWSFTTYPASERRISQAGIFMAGIPPEVSTSSRSALQHTIRYAHCASSAIRSLVSSSYQLAYLVGHGTRTPPLP